MRLSHKNILRFSALAAASYILLMYFVFNMHDFLNVTSSLRHMLTLRATHRVYGLGTVMVDVKSLGQMPALHDYRNVNLDNRSINTYKSHTYKPIIYDRMCFKLIWSVKRTSMIDLSRRSTATGIGQRNKPKETCNRFLAMELSPGRSGNQMFQVAALLGTAYINDVIPVINPGIPLAEWFELPNLFLLNLTSSEKLTVKPSGKYSSKLTSLRLDKNVTLRGYFQSWKYFRGAEHIVRQAFRMKEEFLYEAKTFLLNISKPNYENICVHVRRGDLSDNVAIRKGYEIAGLGFIYFAMDYYRQKFKNAQFVVLSDGIFWCMDNIKGKDVMYSPFYRPAEDMALMTLCDHVIVTSGTFGWWGAWLSGGTVVYYRGYPRPGSWLESQINRKDYYLPNWIAL